jgi:hypothetical protein
MSGRKISKIRLAQEKERKMIILGEINSRIGRIEGLIQMINETIDKVPAGVKAAFAEDVQRATQWKLAAQMKRGKYTVNNSTDDLLSAQSKFGRQIDEGQKILSDLTGTLMQKANTIEKAVELKKIELESTFYGASNSMREWFEPSVVDACEKSLENVEQLLEHHQIVEVNKALIETENNINSRLQELQKLELKYQQRAYVYDALKQVCKDMDFGEVPVKPEQLPAKKRDSLVYTVNTWTGGDITFYLSLDDITTNSEIIKDQCITKFSKISEQLKDNFGVLTHFDLADAKPDETLIRKKELRPPIHENLKHNL